MEKFVFSSTSLEESWSYNKDHTNLFAGNWCINYKDNRLKNINYKIIDYHWNNKNKFFKDSIYIDKIYEEILVKISSKLNLIHDKNYPLQYWRILLNPWLHSFISLLFDRWETVNLAYKKYHIVNSYCLNIDHNEMIPFNSQHFKQGCSTNDIWNHFIFSEILKFKDLKFERKNYNKNYTIRRKFAVISNLSNKKRTGIIKNFKKIFKKIIINFFSNPKIIFINSSFDLITELKIGLSFWQIYINRQFPIETHSGSKNNNIIRDKLIFNLKDKDDFLNFCSIIVPKLIPNSFIEDYHFFDNYLKKNNLTAYPKIIFTSTAHVISENFKHWAAKCQMNGTKLVICQHGASYGTMKVNSFENHELKISDYYFSWGWTNKRFKNKIIKFGNVKNYNKKLIRNKKEKLLLVTFTTGKYFKYLFSNISSSQWLTYHENSKKIYQKFTPEIKKNFLLRPSPGYYDWACEKERWKDAFPKINFALNPNINYHYKQSKLIIVDHDGTPFLECLNFNIPVIMIHNFSLEPVRYFSMKYYDKLLEANICFSNIEEATDFINNNWNSIDKWWYSKIVQKNRIFFMNRFSKKLHNPEKYLKKILHNE